MEPETQEQTSTPPARVHLILRDHLAVDRTVLANERTFLAYIRTALALGVSGLTFVHFLPWPVTTVVGWVFVPLGIGTFVVGLVRYRQESDRMRPLRTQRGNAVYEADPVEYEGRGGSEP